MPRCYIFDIDGTLADHTHRLYHIAKEPKDWRAFFAEVGGDKRIPHMWELCNDLFCTGSTFVYVSGRSDECRSLTQDWLNWNDFPCSDQLYMRKAGDHRPDYQVKGELLDQLLADGYVPIMAFDDRTQVVNFWRSRGVPCAQVAEGDF